LGECLEIGHESRSRDKSKKFTPNFASVSGGRRLDRVVDDSRDKLSARGTFMEFSSRKKFLTMACSLFFASGSLWAAGNGVLYTPAAGGLPACQRDLDACEADKAALQAELDAANARIAQLEQQLASCVTVSPYSGNWTGTKIGSTGGCAGTRTETLTGFVDYAGRFTIAGPGTVISSLIQPNGFVEFFVPASGGSNTCTVGDLRLSCSTTFCFGGILWNDGTFATITFTKL
jgi:hypothetical protein